MRKTRLFFQSRCTPMKLIIDSYKQISDIYNKIGFLDQYQKLTNLEIRIAHDFLDNDLRSTALLFSALQGKTFPTSHRMITLKKNPHSKNMIVKTILLHTYVTHVLQNYLVSFRNKSNCHIFLWLLWYLQNLLSFFSSFHLLAFMPVRTVMTGIQNLWSKGERQTIGVYWETPSLDIFETHSVSESFCNWN